MAATMEKAFAAVSPDGGVRFINFHIFFDIRLNFRLNIICYVSEVFQ